MTDLELAKRMAELRDEFGRMCQARSCEDCELEPIREVGSRTCAHVWVWKRMMAENCGKQDTCPAAQKEEAVMATPLAEEVKLPKWCKEGQWVVAKFDLEANKRVKDCVLKRIVAIDSFGGIAMKTLSGKREYFGWSEYVPIRFRPYRYEEATKLLGKVMEYFSCNGKYKYLMTITDVGESEDGCHVNWYSHTYWSNRNATIDGVPIGVPEVDEDAMKEVK